MIYFIQNSPWTRCDQTMDTSLLIFSLTPQLHESHNNHLGTVKIQVKNYTHSFQYGNSIPGQVRCILYMFVTNFIRVDKRSLSHHRFIHDNSKSPLQVHRSIQDESAYITEKLKIGCFKLMCMQQQ